jgi:hypothetical protein
METSNKLAKISYSELMKEVYRRQEIANNLEEKRRYKEEFEKFKKRPYCCMVGRAYLDPFPKEHTLASMDISGNVGHRYSYVAMVPDTVKLFFHNAWTSNLQREFEEMFQSLGDWFIRTKIINNLEVTIDLIELSKPTREDIKKEWEKAAIERICEFSLEEIKDCLSKEFPTSSKATLLKKAVKEKIGKKKPTKAAKLSTELATALAVAKMQKGA